MKKQCLLKTALLALAGIGLLASPVRAAALSYNAGDLFIGFYSAAGDSQDYLINIGQASTFRDAAGNVTINLGTYGTDLATAFGSDWKSSQDIKWFVFGTTYNQAVGSDPAYTLYAGRQRTDVDVQATAWNLGSSNAQGLKASRMNQTAAAYASGTSTATTTNGYLQTITDANSYASYNASGGTQVFGAYDNGPANFASGTANSVLDLFRMQTGKSSLPGTYEGTFTINDAGTISFTAVPEPSACGLILVAGAAALVVLRRRRSQQAKLAA